MGEHQIEQAADAQKFLNTDELVWFGEPELETADKVLLGLPEEHRFGVVSADGDPDLYAGIYGVYPLTVTIPGPLESLQQVRASGLTWVGVHPDERRRGVLTAMLRDHFERTRDGDWSGLSVLHASEPAIYGRHGYGVATWEADITLGRGTELKSPGLEEKAKATRTRLVSAATPGVAARMQSAALRAHAGNLGAIVREVGTYEQFTRETPQHVREEEPARVLFAERDGVDVGYAWFRRTPKWEDGEAQGRVRVIEMAGDAAAELALARRLVDLDLTSKVVFRGRAVDDLLVQWAGGPRAIHGKSFDSLWVRLVDLPKAMTVRGYAAPCDLVLDVTDEKCEWNQGRWRLTVSAEGTATAERTDDPTDIALSTQTLASAYIGSKSLVLQRDAGLLEEKRDGAVRALDRALRMPQSAVAAAGF